MKKRKLVIAVFLGLAVLVFFINGLLEEKQETPVHLQTITSTPKPLSPTATQSNSVVFKGNSSKKEGLVLLDVPFTSQAPFSEWRDPLQQNGCEEASALMAVSWAQGKQLLGPVEAKDQIIKASQWQMERYATAHDTSAFDTAERILKGYFNWQKVEVKEVESTEEIIGVLAEGKLIIVPVNGRKLNNPYYTRPGPQRHMLVLRGFDFQTSQFIANDSGTRRGETYRYPENILFQAIRDYPTGDNIPVTSVQKRMIVVFK